MKNVLFALTIGLYAIGCNGGTGSGPTEPKGIPVIESAVMDSPAPSLVGDPGYQEDRGGSVPSDRVVGKTGYNRRRLGIIEKQNWGLWTIYRGRVWENRILRSEGVTWQGLHPCLGVLRPAGPTNRRSRWGVGCVWAGPTNRRSRWGVGC